MSYEGFTEYICVNKHYFVKDVYEDDERSICPLCNGRLAFVHEVDQTNGYIKGESSTRPALVKEVGFKDMWKEDYYGNKYAIKEIFYEPNSKEWKAKRSL